MTDTLARALASADDHTIDRRKLLKVGAWAAPVVVLAAAVPAASASDGITQSSVSVPNPTPTATPGNGNSVVVRVSAHTVAPLSITAVMEIKTPADGTWVKPAAGSGITVADGSATTVATATISKVVTSAGDVEFIFPGYKKKESKSTYQYTIAFIWKNAAGTQFSTSVTGDIK